MTYARETSVPVERTRSAIQRLVIDKGASQFMSAEDLETARAIVGWTIGGRMVRLAIPLPDPKENRFTRRRTASGWGHRTFPPDEQRRRWEQGCRSRWRAVLLIVKAKFEAVEAGVSTFEREFLADVVLHDGTTLGEWIAPQLAAMYERGDMPRLLPGRVGGP